MAVARDSSPTPPPPIEACDIVTTDPPPPYPSRERRSRVRPSRRRSGRIQTSHADHDVRIPPYVDEDNAREPNETTPFLSAPGYHVLTARPRSYSHTSTISAAPSLAHTVLSLFQFETDEWVYLDNGEEDRQLLSGDDNGSLQSSRSHSTPFFSSAAWKRYFRPLTRKSYYTALFHLMVLNFPYALAALVYLFVFTVTGTTLLVVLPLGAVLCFFNLLGARVFSRGELALQTRFHSPLVHPTPYPPHPIFTRYREPTATELETGRPPLTRNGMVRERSFYKNTYAMFTDSTSYQALFYFLVIKPAITLLISLGLIIVGLPLIILILPAPAALRAIRKIGIWQANVAIEGLYFAVR